MKYIVFAALAVFCLLSLNSVSEAVEAHEIDVIRNKGVLGSDDLQMIDDFIAEQVDLLVNTVDFSSVARVRAVLVSRTNSNRPSAQAQYISQFSESAYRYISRAFNTVEDLDSQDRRFKVLLNLLILVDGLEDPRLSDLAIGRIESDNKAVRYWAVHAVTNEGITKKLGSGISNTRLAVKIVEKLDKIADITGPQETRLIAEFAAAVGIEQAGKLLLKIADKRINKYADWTVDYELLDARILQLLSDKTSSFGSDKASFARRFGQLYSYVMERYIQGRNNLSVKQKEQLASVLVEIEDTCLGKLLDLPQSVIKTAIEKNNYNALKYEHSRLFGNGSTQGRLAVKLNFDYGRTSEGQKRVSPVDLASPPNT